MSAWDRMTVPQGRHYAIPGKAPKRIRVPQWLLFAAATKQAAALLAATISAE
jgi:hypothetical protein